MSAANDAPPSTDQRRPSGVPGAVSEPIDAQEAAESWTSIRGFGILVGEGFGLLSAGAAIYAALVWSAAPREALAALGAASILGIGFLAYDRRRLRGRRRQLERQAASLESDLRLRTSDLDQAASRLASTEAEKSRLEGEKQEAIREVAKLAERSRNLEKDLESSRMQVHELENVRRDLEGRLADHSRTSRVNAEEAERLRNALRLATDARSSLERSLADVEAKLAERERFASSIDHENQDLKRRTQSSVNRPFLEVSTSTTTAWFGEGEVVFHVRNRGTAHAVNVGLRFAPARPIVGFEPARHQPYFDMIEAGQQFSITVGKISAVQQAASIEVQGAYEDLAGNRYEIRSRTFSW